jgi:hypothetical protein
MARGLGGVGAAASPALSTKKPRAPAGFFLRISLPALHDRPDSCVYNLAARAAGVSEDSR